MIVLRHDGWEVAKISTGGPPDEQGNKPSGMHTNKPTTWRRRRGRQWSEWKAGAMMGEAEMRAILDFRLTAFYCSEPDGRLYVARLDDQGVPGPPIFAVDGPAIDKLADLLRSRLGSDGDGKPFAVDFWGEVEDL